MALSIRNLRTLLCEGYSCFPHMQLGRGGTLEVLSTSTAWRTQHTAGDAASLQNKGTVAPQAARIGGGRTPATQRKFDNEPDDLDEPPMPPMRFVSREQRTFRQPAARRIPICFPTITLQMLKLRDKQMAQLRETGWLREVAFKTTPDVTKLEIAAYLESVYGMSVERVSTINYLGRVRQDAPAGRNKRHLYREDDWKKAYVVFRPPPGMGHLLTQGEAGEGGEAGEEGRPVIEQVREAARAPRPAPRPVPWKRRPRG
ncbi:hypothetical protein PLESTB_001142000 [Pleodorina starrii]|uniref:Large ribosomal subunit protein uL23c n=1 Tax=Pleodorina starrii TaxID=330485 RepID=A0A9W6BRF1_9CHLO|nr:hypothetical protein PLESTM_000562600 [Pleodorina starrii]GLC56753.1 hypothetical protein PLESTB_001142000 [Pleodorina starrii]GLC66909.1 hypothetical protein PLESTF_000489300 [Pleodorina starrii]